MLREKRMPEFKLFGKTIQISAIKAVSLADEAGCDIADEQPPLKKQACPAHQNSNKEEEDEEETNTPANTAVLDPEANSKYDDEEEHNQLSNNQEDNSPKKPTKILPCPRCKSKDTKFCYYNNYNVNQPRHFCKNCQRYWTAGGSMRNVPVGAGRRKTKCSAPTLIPDLARVNPGSICHLQPPKFNGMVLSFGPDAPLGESMTSVLNLVEKTMKNCDANSNCYSFPPAAYFNGSTPWPSSWCPPPPFYPLNAYWGMPWLLPQLSSSPSSTSSGSNTNSSALGKRSRDGTLLNHSNSDPANPDKSIWIPKTTRADDHEKAAKFPTWPAMGFKNDGFDTISRGEGFFKAFKSSGGQKIHSAEISQILLANPAAVSRSFCFQES